MKTGKFITIKELETEIKQQTKQPCDFEDYFTYIRDELDDEPERLYIVEKYHIEGVLKGLNEKSKLTKFEMELKDTLEFAEIVMKKHGIELIVNI